MKIKSAIKSATNSTHYESSIKTKPRDSRRQAMKESHQSHKNFAAGKRSILSDQERDRP